MISIVLYLLVSCGVSTSKNKIIIHEKATQRNDLSQLMWWKNMHDPILTKFINQALDRNNQILAAKETIVQAQALLKGAYVAWLPTVNLTDNHFFLKGWDTHSNPQGALAQIPTMGSLSDLDIKGHYTGFVPDYSLNILENINNAKLAKASLATQKAMYQSTRLSIISQTAGSYFTLLGQKQQLEEQQQMIRHMHKLHQLETVRYTSGASDYSVLADLDQELYKYQASLASIENSIRQVENTLQLLINHDPGPVITDNSLNRLSTKNIIPAHLSSQVLQNRPDIMIAKEQLNKADAHLGLSYASFFPQLSLTGLLGGSSIELIHLLKLTTGLGVAQLAARMPILNGALYQQIQASKAGVKAEYYNYLQTVRAALVDVDNRLTKQQKSNQAYRNQLDALNASMRAYSLILARYKAGLQDRRAVIHSLINVDQAKINLTLAKMDYLNSIVALYQALAGGYQNKNDII
jgi:NodT family efflux transporter outer membrane factor (OMF) lipoprotein